MSNTSKLSGYLSRHKHSVIDKMLRVNHAGELGADRIYHGQSFVLNRDRAYGPAIQEMWNHEKAHLEEMEYMNLKYRTRKSLLEPFWSIGGFLMGAGTASLGPKAAMACTEAVEKVISRHYNDQIRDLVSEGDVRENQYILDKLSKFRDDEQHHHDTAREYQEENDNARLKTAIDTVCNVSIKVAENI